MQNKQYPLPVTDPNDIEAATAAHQKLIEDLAAAVANRLNPTSPKGPASQSVSACVSKYLAEVDRRLSLGKIQAKTVMAYRSALTPFVAKFGQLPIESLTSEIIEAWADDNRWSQSTKNSYLGTVKTFLKAEKCHIEISRPPKESRGADTILTDDQFDQVLSHAVRGVYLGDFKALMCVLRETGARPGEISRLMVADVDWVNTQVRHKQHKTRHRTGRERTIHFNTEAMKILTAHREKYGTGLLFRTRNGNAYKPGTIVRRCGEISKRVGFRVIAYGLGRHSFATAALAAGVPDAVVAELLGHRGTAMITAHYSHLGQQSRVLKAAAERVSRAG